MRQTGTAAFSVAFFGAEGDAPLNRLTEPPEHYSLENPMPGFIARSKPTGALLSAVLVASALLAPAALAGPTSAGETYTVPHDNGIYDGTSQNSWGGNASEIPLVRPGAQAFYRTSPMQPRAHMTGSTRTKPVTNEPSVVARSNSNPAAVCSGGYRWEETAANGWTLPIRCQS